MTYYEDDILISPCCGYLTLHLKSEDSGNGKFITWRKCRKCGNEIAFNDLVLSHEYKNIKRTKMIDRMLNERT